MITKTDNAMKEKQIYAAPEVEVVKVRIEQNILSEQAAPKKSLNMTTDTSDWGSWE